MSVPVFAVLVLALTGATAAAADIDRQRSLFMRVYPAAEQGNWQAFQELEAADRDALRDYVLWPDLRAAWFRARIDTAAHDDIEAFLSQYATLRPVRELRYHYAVHLAGAGRLDAFLEIYRQYYQGLDVARLDCLALQAEIAAGAHQRVVNRAKVLWTVGESQVDECDPVFAWLKREDLLTQPDYRRRFELAIDAREFTMARWLGKSIDQQHIDIAAGWIRAARDPEAFVRRHRSLPDDIATVEQLVYAVERITYDDPLLALDLWKDLAKGRRFSAEQELRTWRHIALWLARDRLPGAHAELARLPVAAQSSEVLRWRARTSLREQDWPALLADIGLMDEAERAREEWLFWRGIALRHSGNAAEASAILVPLARERSYYGFLAADELGQPYALNDSRAAPDEATIAALASKIEFVRARELYRVGLDGRGRSEWDAALAFLDTPTKLQAAILAQRWDWHSRAIAAAASVGEYDDLALRYPLPFAGVFARYSADASIPATWAFGVARSESLFMRDVRSSAGAVGLMQLMPATGRKVASELRLPYSGLSTLTDPDSNIRLGTTYLGQMARRFGGHRVLATAAYNAGPHRVEAWLPESGTIDARAWIENIPFDETRSYVRRVFEAETIFHWRLTGDTRRLSDELSRVPAGTERVARN